MMLPIMGEQPIPAGSCAAERREDGDQVLYVDPVAMMALRTALADGGTPASFGALPSLDELPLRVVVIETRLDQLEALIERGKS